MAALKYCVECGRVYVPTSNRQKFCPRCRFKAAPRPGTTYGTRMCVVCGGTFEARAHNQRFCGKRCAGLASRPKRRAKYEHPAHRARRRMLEPVVAMGMTRCARGAACKFAEFVDGFRVGGYIVAGAAWDLGHPDGESAGGPEHSICNRGAPSRHRKRRTL